MTTDPNNHNENANTQIAHLPIALGSKIFGTFFSYLFHPLLIPIYVGYFLLFIHATAFAGFSDAEKNQTLLIIGLNLVLFPLLSVLLLKALGFVSSLFLPTQKDRIIPYIAAGIFFFWAFTVFKQQPLYPRMLVSFILGIFLASSAALLANIYFKVSMHAIGMGGWLGFFLVLVFKQDLTMGWPLAVVILLVGLVCTARLILQTHRPLDIYAGLLIGLLTQFIAAYFIK